MHQIDPWEKAAECQRYLQAEVDSTQREILTNVRDLWIGLANARNILTAAEEQEEVEKLNRIHVDLIRRLGGLAIFVEARCRAS